MVPRSTKETTMYLDDIIDHAKAYFIGNEGRTATLKIKIVSIVAIRLDHATAGFAARHVAAVAIYESGRSFQRAYIVLEYPNGEIETLEIGCLMSKQGIRMSVDEMCEAFLAKT